MKTTLELNVTLEAAVLKQSQEALKEFTTACVNIGLSKEQVAMMLRHEADELAGRIFVENDSGALN